MDIDHCQEDDWTEALVTIVKGPTLFGLHNCDVLPINAPSSVMEVPPDAKIIWHHTLLVRSWQQREELVQVLLVNMAMQSSVTNSEMCWRNPEVEGKGPVGAAWCQKAHGDDQL